MKSAPMLLRLCVFTVLVASAQACLAPAGAAEPVAPKVIKVYRVGSSSFSHPLIEGTRAIVEALGNYKLVCDAQKDQAGYTRLDQFLTQPGLYEEWCEAKLPKIEAGKYDFVIFQTMGWLSFEPEQIRKLYAEILPDLTAKIRKTGAQVILYDKYLPLQFQQKNPKARTWCGRYPEGYRLGYLLHIAAAKNAGIEKISFGGAAVTELWQQERFAKLRFLYCDTGHPGAMANYISAVNLAFLLTGQDPVGSPVRKLPVQGWAALAFKKLPESDRERDRKLHEANKHRVTGNRLVLSDEEARALQEAAMKSQRKWGAILQENLDSDEVFAATMKEIARIQGEMDKFEAYGLDAGTVARLKEQYTEAAEPGELKPSALKVLRRKSKSIDYADTILRNYCRELLSREKGKLVRAEFTRYWDENNSKLRDNIYFPGRVLEAKMTKAGNRAEMKRIKATTDRICYVLSLPGFKIVLKHADAEQKKKVLANYDVHGWDLRGAPVFGAYQNKVHNDQAKLEAAWDMFLDIWTNPNLLDKLKDSNYSIDVFLEADKEFERRLAAGK
jgi:hypothetical protein